eukprot:1590850-Lingulodinium_polyedra.AAC.1
MPEPPPLGAPRLRSVCNEYRPPSVSHGAVPFHLQSDVNQGRSMRAPTGGCRCPRAIDCTRMTLQR